MGLEACQIYALIEYLPLIWVIEPIDTVEETGFSCAIGSNYGKYFAVFYLKAYVIQGLQPAKFEGQIVNFNDNFIFVLSH